jgi:hypothetical protein
VAWSAPMTAVDNTTFTAAQFNAHVRDNLLETMPGKASTNGGYFVGSGTNSIVERIAATNFNAAAGTTTSASYTATLSGTPGTNPSVTVTTGASARIILTGQNYSDTVETWAMMGYAISGATNRAATDDHAWGYEQTQLGSSQQAQFSCERLLTDLTPGSNTFTLQYKAVNGGTATFQRRSITVIPF